MSIYRCIARLDGIDRVFSSETDGGDNDRIVVDRDGYAIESEAPDGDATLYDLDAIEAWCKSADGVCDPNALLNAWNLFVDVPGLSDLFKAADTNALGVYDKLFWSLGIIEPAPVCVWTGSEVAMLKRVLLLGLTELRARFRDVDSFVV